MNPATLPALKKELQQLDHNDIVQICLRLGRFKKENKELLTYLLFDSKDEASFINSIKHEIDDMMESINTSNLYYTKKGLRKINRSLTRYIRYSGKKQTEVEVWLHFAKAMKNSSIPVHRYLAIGKLYENVKSKIQKALKYLHEDIQTDYQYEVDQL